MLVLSALALIAFLALAILTFVRSESRAAQSVADMAELRTLQGLPEKLVISQLRNATRDLMKNDLGYTWVSQPGMIRVYGTDVTAGSPRADVAEFYKLYSSEQMEVRDPTWNPAMDAEAAAKGAVLPGLWTDLNEPVRVRERRSLSQPGSGQDTRLVFPILDPAAFQRGYDGLSLVGTQPVGNSERLPMPVRWLYVLKDGSVVAPMVGGQDGKVINVPGARVDNPIIGRIAFWTDDESCKLNLNTASEAAPWERPLTTSEPDRAHADSQPARWEHYREAAHPAFTSLSPVLRHFGKTAVSQPSYSREPQEPLTSGQSWANEVKRIHELLPRSPTWEAGRFEGSMAGTTETKGETKLKRERLLANVDELFFSGEVQADEERVRNGQNSTLSVTQEDIETSRFLLTTRSRAPETNPFGWPKISLWPVAEQTSERHQVDERMCLAATLDPGGARLPFYLQRAANWRSELDPGSSQSSMRDMQVQRNRELFDYLLTMTDNVMPGVGGAFVDKYGAPSRSQLLVSMFDMLRWGVNPMSPYDQNLRQELTPEYSYLPPSEDPGSPDGVGAFSAVPLQHDVDGARHRGIGRFPTLTEVALVLFATKAKLDDTPPVDAKGFYKKTEEFRAFIVVEPKVLAAGMPGVSPAWRMRVAGHEGAVLKVGNKQVTLDFPINPTDSTPDLKWSPTVRVCASPALGGSLGNHGPYAGIAAQFLKSDRSPREWHLPDGADDDEGRYFVLGSADVNVADALIDGGENEEVDLPAFSLTVEIYDDSSPSLNDDGALVQVLELQIPAQKVPLPRMHQEDATGTLDERIQSRFTLAEVAGTGAWEVPFLRKGDVVRAAQSSRAPGINGDTRLQASLVVLGTSYFEPVQPTAAASMSPEWYQVHNLRDDAFMAGEHQPGFRGENWDKGRATLDPALPVSLVKRPVEPGPGTALAYGQKAVPGVEAGLPAAINLDGRPGDFDNGPGVIEDGPYVNLPDFGNWRTQEDAGRGLGATVVGGYFQRGGRFFEDDGGTFSPLRQMGSAVGFGSLPSAVLGDTLGGTASQAARPWTTLLFCPHPPSRLSKEDEEPDYMAGAASSAKKDHFGFATPRDHLWLEFFWMPVAEQAGLTDGFSTEGKVNMNYQIQPFHWIRRATAMHGALHGVRVTAIPSSAVTDAAGADHYKHFENGNGSGLSFRYAVDAEQTLRQFDERFERGELFITPSEICEQFLVPRRLDGHRYESGTVQARDPATVAPSYTGVMDWWEGADTAQPGDGFEATGDNTRESPYAQLYPRLCTRSNVFKVHYRVQVLQKAASTSPNVWDEAKDRIGADYRGEATIERYLDPRRTGIVDFATSSGVTQTLFDYHDFRVTGRRQFVP